MLEFDWPNTDGFMDIYSPDGTKVVFAARGGRDSEIELAKRWLTLGETYTVEHTEVGQSTTRVYLYEFPGIGFNSVMFDKVKE